MPQSLGRIVEYRHSEEPALRGTWRLHMHGDAGTEAGPRMASFLANLPDDTEIVHQEHQMVADRGMVYESWVVWYRIHEREGGDPTNADRGV